MNPNVSLVTEVEVATEVVAVAGVAVVDGAATVVGAAVADGACCPMGIPGWLRLQVSPHHCGRIEETSLMDHGDGGDKRVCRIGHHVNGHGV